MGTLRTTCFGSLALGLVWVPLISTTRIPLHAGEPIQISGFTNKVSLPRKDSTDSLLNRPGDFFKSGRSGDPGSDLPDMTPIPNQAKNKRGQEQLDLEKNWIFQTPGTMKSEPTPEEMFGLQENPWNTRSKPSSRMLENFWKDKERKTPQKNPYSPSERSDTEIDGKDKPALEDFSSAVFGTEARGRSRTSTLNWNGLFNEKGRSNGQNQDSNELMGGLFNQKKPNASSSLVTGLEAPEFKGPQKERDDDFFKILNPSASKTFLPAKYDPINSAPDSTRQEINPVVGKTVEDFSRAASPLGALSGLQANGFVPPGLQPPAFDDLNARLLGQPSFKPALPPQSGSGFLVPKPAVLEFPKRKF